MLGTRIHMFSRLLACLVCLVVWLQTAESSASAEDKPPTIVVLTANQTAAQIEAAVKAASEGGAPVLIRWAEETLPPAASNSRDQSMAAMNNMWMIGDFQKALANGTEGAIAGISRLPAVFQTSGRQFPKSRVAPHSQPGCCWLVQAWGLPAPMVLAWF